MIDKVEARRRGQSKSKKTAQHPYAALEHRIIDSPAYQTLSFSAQALIILLARQITKDGNNGHLQATFAWCKPYGFGSGHTLQRAIAELIAHGLVYRTRSHGANKAWARYALTWLPIKDREGLFLGGFVANAWRDWVPPPGKRQVEKNANGKKQVAKNA
jgi:hypothetical protein